LRPVGVATGKLFAGFLDNSSLLPGIDHSGLATRRGVL
jgi:hypothetical protein